MDAENLHGLDLAFNPKDSINAVVSGRCPNGRVAQK